MSNLFVKLLPVEEINEHDVVTHKDGRRGTIVHVYPDSEAFELEFSENTERLGLDRVQTVKRSEIKKEALFVCSRDIQVGDDIWFTSIIGKLRQGKFYHITKGSQGEDIVDLTENGEGSGFELGSKEPNAFKVMGLLRPEFATSLKDGDELNEKQIFTEE